MAHARALVIGPGGAWGVGVVSIGMTVGCSAPTLSTSPALKRAGEADWVRCGVDVHVVIAEVVVLAIIDGDSRSHVIVIVVPVAEIFEWVVVLCEIHEGSLGVPVSVDLKVFARGCCTGSGQSWLWLRRAHGQVGSWCWWPKWRADEVVCSGGGRKPMRWR